MTLWKIFAVDTQFKQLRKRSLKKSPGFSGIRTRDLCDTGAVLYQLSYEAKPSYECKQNVAINIFIVVINVIL